MSIQIAQVEQALLERWGASMAGMTECAQEPANPADGDVFTCPACGHTAEYVVLDDGRPGEWVSVE